MHENLIQFLTTLNVMHGTIGNRPRFTWEEDGRYLTVYGITADLSLLYALLWTTIDHYSLYYVFKDGKTGLEFWYDRRD